MTKPRLIVLTGCTRGLGRALTEYFISRGITIAGCGRSAATIGDLRHRHPAPHDFATVDVSDNSWVAEWARRIVDTLGAPDFVINNAAVTAPNSPLWDASCVDVDATIDINIKGTIHVIRQFLPHMICAGSGVIVNMSSGWGRTTSPDVATYCASKWAIEGLTQALAQELPKGLSAIALNPGIINTEMLRMAFGEAAQSYPDPTSWALHAGPYILKMSARENGRSLSVPGVPLD